VSRPLLQLKETIAYGPIRSRRLGASLGINLLPHAGKLCNFNCVYCQYGWTPGTVTPASHDHGLPSVEEVAQQVRETLCRLRSKPDYLTFSGNGEPTLHPEFPAIVTAVARVRDVWAPASRLALLSNSTRAGDPLLRPALEQLDLRVMKLDAGNEAVLAAYNGAAGRLSISAIVEGLATLPDVTIQALFAGGRAGNSGPAEVEAWLEQIARVRPTHVQIYTLDRGTPSRDIEVLPAPALEAIADRVRRLGLAATVY
jgi:wyosine [tRNA(Phe)-imidazoG37] synthetase (radical SAM superfamily)